MLNVHLKKRFVTFILPICFSVFVFHSFHDTVSDTLCHQTQQESPQQTTLQLYAALARLRQEPAFRKGDLLFALTTPAILSYVRQLPGNDADRYLVVLNLGVESSKNNYSGDPVLASRGVVVQATCSVIDRLWKDKEVDLTDLELAPGDGVVVSLQ